MDHIYDILIVYNAEDPLTCEQVKKNTDYLDKKHVSYTTNPTHRFEFTCYFLDNVIYLPYRAHYQWATLMTSKFNSIRIERACCLSEDEYFIQNISHNPVPFIRNTSETNESECIIDDIELCLVLGLSETEPITRATMEIALSDLELSLLQTNGTHRRFDR